MTDRLTSYLEKLRAKLDLCRTDADVTDAIRTAGADKLTDSDRVTPEEHEQIRRLVAEFRAKLRRIELEAALNGAARRTPRKARRR